MPQSSAGRETRARHPLCLTPLQLLHPCFDRLCKRCPRVRPSNQIKTQTQHRQERPRVVVRLVSHGCRRLDVDRDQLPGCMANPEPIANHSCRHQAASLDSVVILSMTQEPSVPPSTFPLLRPQRLRLRWQPMLPGQFQVVAPIAWLESPRSRPRLTIRLYRTLTAQVRITTTTSHTGTSGSCHPSPSSSHATMLYFFAMTGSVVTMNP